MAKFSQDAASAELNQYWYSDATIAALVKEIEMHATSAAFLSTPSLYFALTSSELRAKSNLFEYDRQWEKDPGFVFYDFNKPESVPVTMWGKFDYIVVDPPFITREVWTKYVQTVNLIAAKGCKFLFTSVIENQQMLEELVDGALIIPDFRPSIPKLTYQYHCFANYEPQSLLTPNPELPAEEANVVAARRLANDMRESQNAFKAQAQSRNREGEVPLPAHERAAAAEGADPAMKWTHVPAGLTEYAGGASGPADSASAPASAEYLNVEARRNKMTTLRTLIDQVIKAAEGAIKPYIALRAAAAKGTTDADAQAKVDAQEAAKAAHLDELVVVVKELAAMDAADARGICAVMGKFVEEWRAPLTEKDTYMERCADATRLYKSPVFNRQKELLAELKTIKKRDVAAAQQ
jgi:hypothetical protein